MPRVNIWIRKEDEQKWDAIADKPAWLHCVLNGHVLPVELVTQFIKESGALESEATLQQFVDYCESLVKIKNG